MTHRPSPHRTGTFRVVVLASGSGSLLQALLDSERAGTLPATIVAVGSDRRDARALERAAAAGVPTFCHRLPPGADRQQWDAELTELVAQYEPDLVVSAGFMKLLGATFLARFGGRAINSHPALLPSFPGMHAVRDALEHGVKVTGATVFTIDAGVDTGEILAQAAVPVHPGDTVDALHERIKVVERGLLVQTIGELAAIHETADHRK